MASTRGTITSERDEHSILATLLEAVPGYKDGDVFQLADWAGMLGELGRLVTGDRAETVTKLIAEVKTAMRHGAPEKFQQTLLTTLEALAGPPEPVADDHWSLHGPVFLAETRPRLARAQELILSLEARPDAESTQELFRIFHTIKGEGGFLKRQDVADIAHATEELLDQLRAGIRRVDRPLVNRLLEGVDRLDQLLFPKETGPTTARHREALLRVPAVKIDGLIDLVGELLVTLDSEAASPTVRKLSRGLQQAALQLRTEPLSDLWGRLRRGGRDLAQQLNKPVEIVLDGEELELDRNLIAVLEEPLMHLVRNCLDHGIELPGRRPGDKPPVGRLTIQAQRKGNRIQIRVADDGRGLDADRIWAKALEKGLVSGPRPQDLKQIHSLVFHPGFSTADQLSQVSGRGVGMDIVASAVQGARGHIDLESVPGRGTTFLLSFPLSTAVLDGLVVLLGDRRFILPVHSVIEALRPGTKDLRQVVPGVGVFTLRGRTLPVLSLRQILDGSGEVSASAWGVVVETSGGARQLLLVDDVDSKREVVIRSLGPGFEHLRGVSAATILSGGTLALVLDVDQLIDLSEGME